jgi:hypothetical protein
MEENTLKGLLNKTGNEREACSCNHFCGGKEIRNISSVFVFVALGIEHAIRMCHCVVCDLSWSTIFFYIIS